MDKKWMIRFIDLADDVSDWSKDPSTKTGAVIVSPNQRIISTGYNGYPRGCEGEATDDRETKYAKVIHAEMNAILYARENLEGCTIFITHPPCSRCTAVIIQAGIKQVYWMKPGEAFLERWPSTGLSEDMFKEAGVDFYPVEFNYLIAPK